MDCAVVNGTDTTMFRYHRIRTGRSGIHNHTVFKSNTDTKGLLKRGGEKPYFVSGFFAYCFQTFSLYTGPLL